MAVETLQDLLDLIETGPSDVRESLELIKKQLPTLPEASELNASDLFLLQDVGNGSAKRIPRSVVDMQYSHASKQTKASGSLVNLFDVPHGGTVHITGDETIESFGSGVDGKQVVVVFDGEATIVNEVSPAQTNINTGTGEDYEARPAVINERIRMMYDDEQWHFISLPPPVRIENANGWARRQADGDQVIWRRTTVTQDQPPTDRRLSADVQLPASFISTNGMVAHVSLPVHSGDQFNNFDRDDVVSWGPSAPGGSGVFTGSDVRLSVFANSDTVNENSSIDNVSLTINGDWK